MVYTIASKRNGLRTYYVENRPVNAIHFYRDGAVLLSTRSGWIESENEYPRDMPGLTLSSPLRRANKINLTKGGHFYVTAASRLHFDGSRVDVYIDITADRVTIGDAEVVELYRQDTGITYHSVRRLTANFAGEEKTITIAVPESVFIRSNTYGDKIASIQERMKSLGGGDYASMRTIETIIKDKTLLDLLVDAHALVKT